MNTAVLCGGTGFVGRHLGGRLEKLGWRVVSLGRSSDEKELETVLHEANLVFHLAANIAVQKSLEDPESFIRENTEVTLKIVRCLRKNERKLPVCYLSSDRIYGSSRERVTEETLPSPIDPYGASKLISEEILRAYSQCYGIPVVVIRASNLYGPRQRPIQLIPSLINELKKGTKKTKVGNLSVRRNFLYIDDLMEGVLRIIQHGSPQGETFQVWNLSGEECEMTEIVRLIQELSKKIWGHSIEIESHPSLFRPEKDQVGGNISYDKAKKILDWHPQVGLREGIERTLEIERELP